VRVHTRGGGEGIEADAVLLTVPLGVLKARSVKFDPPLPAWKGAAVERLGFGPIEKIVLLFERRFWDADADFFGCLPPPELGLEELSARRGEFFLFWNLERSHGAPALICISSGMFAERAWRSHSYKGVVNKALAVLRRAFGPQVGALYKRSVVSDWGRNPYARGSYSYIAVGGSGRDYDELAWPIGVDSQRVFFAGEHTNGQHPATATGAFITGLREAHRIDECARNGFAPAPRDEPAEPAAQ
jgi:monoamine oxidase